MIRPAQATLESQTKGKEKEEEEKDENVYTISAKLN